MARTKKGYINIILEVYKRLQEKKNQKFWLCYEDNNSGFDVGYSNEKEINPAKHMIYVINKGYVYRKIPFNNHIL